MLPLWLNFMPLLVNQSAWNQCSADLLIRGQAHAVIQHHIVVKPLCDTTSGLLTQACAGRRWRKHGFLVVSLVNLAMLMGFLLGLHPSILATWYFETS